MNSSSTRSLAALATAALLAACATPLSSLQNPTARRAKSWCGPSPTAPS